MLQPVLNLTLPLSAFADEAHLDALSSAAKALMDDVYRLEYLAGKSARRAEERTTFLQQADEKSATAVLLLELHNALGILRQDSAVASSGS
jgi:hypothetical protein